MKTKSTPNQALWAQRDVWLSLSSAGRVRHRIAEALARARANARLLGSYVNGLTPNGEKAPFIMFGLMRSGTTVLGDLLAQHPEVTWLGEAYVQAAYFPALYLNALVRESPTACVGLKAFSFQLSPQDSPLIPHGRSDIDRGRRILARLRDQGWKFIHLTRNDIFAQAVSLALATQSGLWHRALGQSENHTKGRLDSREFEIYLDFLIKCRRYEQEIFSGSETFHLNYEAELLDPSHHQVVADRVFAYLTLPKIAVSSKMVKLAGERLDMQIENYDELARAAETLGVTPTR